MPISFQDKNKELGPEISKYIKGNRGFFKWFKNINSCRMKWTFKLNLFGSCAENYNLSGTKAYPKKHWWYKNLGKLENLCQAPLRQCLHLANCLNYWKISRQNSLNSQSSTRPPFWIAYPTSQRQHRFHEACWERLGKMSQSEVRTQQFPRILISREDLFSTAMMALL